MILSNDQSSISDLQAFEIQNTKLNSELIVLSACNTGVGDVLIGEGVASLACSFTYAGAKSVLISLWSIPDFSTAEIIHDFFNNLKGTNKSIALRNAKIKYLEKADEHLSNPKFWAGLNISGDISIIKMENSRFWTLIILSTCSIVFLSFLFWRKNF